MIRPELAATFRRWSEAIWAGAGVALGVWLFTRGVWLFQGVGLVFALACLALMIIAIRRARFQTGQGGPGVIQLDEGRIRYFGPFYGGAVSLAELGQIDIGPLKGGKLVWLLHSPGQAALMIPTAAKGGEAMFDAFATLPGIDMGHLIAATQNPPDTRITLWRRDAQGALTPR